MDVDMDWKFHIHGKPGNYAFIFTKHGGGTHMIKSSPLQLFLDFTESQPCGARDRLTRDKYGRG